MSEVEARAQFILGLMLSLARKIHLADSALKEGKWLKKELTGIELKNRTVTIVGEKNLPEGLSKVANAFEMKVRSASISTIDEAKQSDFLIICDDKIDVNSRLVNMMKKDSFLVLVRQKSVDIAAVRAALSSKHLAGVAVQGERKAVAELERAGNVLFF